MTHIESDRPTDGMEAQDSVSAARQDDDALSQSHAVSTMKTWECEGSRLQLKNSARKLERFVPSMEAALAANIELFGYTLPELSFVICNNPEEWERESQPYHIPFARAVTLDDGTVVMKSPELAGIDFSYFESIAEHEVNHSYWMHSIGQYGAGWSPIWLVEALASSLGTGVDLISREEVVAKCKERGISADEALRFEYTEPENDAEIVFTYSMWKEFLGFICPESPADIFPCVESFMRNPSQAGFEDAFREHFDASLEEMFGRFLAS